MQAADMVSKRPAKPNWKQRLEAAPIALPNGKMLVTLDDARHYLTKQKIPTDEREQQILAQAIKSVTGAAHGTDFVMHARIAVSQWVHRNDPPKEFDPDLKLPKFGKRKLKRDL
jgi:hypothetical protein